VQIVRNGVLLTENQTLTDILLAETPKPRLLQLPQLQYIRWYQWSLVQAFRAMDKQISWQKKLFSQNVFRLFSGNFLKSAEIPGKN
jgi:hypothetical protein